MRRQQQAVSGDETDLPYIPTWYRKGGWRFAAVFGGAHVLHIAFWVCFSIVTSDWVRDLPGWIAWSFWILRFTAQMLVSMLLSQWITLYSHRVRREIFAEINELSRGWEVDPIRIENCWLENRLEQWEHSQLRKQRQRRRALKLVRDLERGC